MASLGQKALLRAFKENRDDRHHAYRQFMTEVLQDSHLLTEVVEYYVRHETDFFYEVEEDTTS